MWRRATASLCELARKAICTACLLIPSETKYSIRYFTLGLTDRAVRLPSNLPGQMPHVWAAIVVQKAFVDMTQWWWRLLLKSSAVNRCTARLSLWIWPLVVSLSGNRGLEVSLMKG